MRKLLLGAMMAGAINLAQATETTYTFSPTGLSSMDGENYYEWGISWNLPAGQTIVDATLTYSDIKLTTSDPNGAGTLWSTLLQSPPKAGVSTFTDNDNPEQNPSGAGVFLLGSQTFAAKGTMYTSLSYDFDDITGALSTLDTDVASGLFGIGIDPDCIYTNAGITLTITTQPAGTHISRTPDAASTAMLLGLAFLGIGLYRRNK